MLKLFILLCLALEETAVFVYNFILFSSPKKKRVQIITYLGALVTIFIFHSVSSFYGILINILSFLFVNVFVLVFLYKLNLFTAFLHALLISGFSIISEAFVGNAFQKLTTSFWSDWNSINNLLLLSPSIIVFMLLTITAACFEKKIANKDKQKIDIFIVIGSATISFATIVIDYLAIIKTDDFLKKNNILAINVIVFIFLFFAFLLLFSYMRYREVILSRQKQMQQIEKDNAVYFSELKERNLSQRILIHDLKKHLNSIQIMVQNNELESLNEYITKLFNSPALAPSIRYCQNDFINAIIYKYQKEAEEKGISFLVSSNTVSFAGISNLDITVILCNLLDNAFTASLNSENKYINITLTQDDKKNIDMIIIVNSCTEKVTFVEGIPLHNRNNQDSSFHGLGLKSVISSVQKYDGSINMYQDENNDFHTVVVLNREEN